MKKPQRKSSTPKKTVSRKRSRVKTDAIRAFQLVCALIVVSICVSFAIIMTRQGAANREHGAVSSEQGAVSSEKREERKEKKEKRSVADDNISGVPVPKIIVQEEKPEPAKPVPAPKAELNPKPEPVVSREQGTGNREQGTPVTTTNTVSRTTTAASTRSIEHKGSVAFVIDDAGNNLRELEPFLRIDGPLTIAVLPGLPNSAEAAKRIRAAGKEVILHQPMEAQGGQNPGPSAIYSNMSKDQIIATLKKNIEEVGPVAGINNHQGSKITMDKEIMETILAFCAENNIYFLDSRTTAETAAPAVARRLGIKIGERDTFLDNEQDRESMIRYLSNGLTRAQRNGTSVMIGHTHSPALAPLLAEQYPVLTIQGYTIKTVSEMLK